MDGVYAWIRNLTGFFLFLSVIDNLLPGKAYTRYIRLFSGMVLILIVMQPFTSGLRLEERIAGWYETFVFQYRAEELEQEILNVEEKRLDQLIGQYERAVEMDVRAMAEDAGFSVRELTAAIGKDQGAEDFGRVTKIRMTLEPGEGSQEMEQAGKLRREIAACYELEDAYVEIQIAERKG